MSIKAVSQGAAYFSSLLFIVLGFFLVFFQEKTTFWLLMYAPILLFLSNGISKLFSYFRKDTIYPWIQSYLGLAIVNITVVVAFLCFEELFKKSLTTFIGFTLFTETVFQLQTAWQMKGCGLKRWWCVLTLALFAWALMLIIMLKPMDVLISFGYPRIMGGIYLLNGCANGLISSVAGKPLCS